MEDYPARKSCGPNPEDIWRIKGNPKEWAETVDQRIEEAIGTGGSEQGTTLKRRFNPHLFTERPDSAAIAANPLEI